MATRTWEGATSGAYATAGNWVEGAVPIAGDAVTIPATSTRAIDSDLNQSAVALASFTVEEGAPAMGTETAYLQIATGAGVIRFAGAGTSLLDVGASTTVIVDNTVTPATGYRGLYLKGSGIATLTINGGHVGLAWRAGETSTVTTIRVAGASTTAWIGSGTTLTTYQQDDGSSILMAAATTVNVNGGILITRGTGAITTSNVYGGIFYANSMGTVTTMNIFGGTVDALTSGIARIFTNLKLDPGGILRYNPAHGSITTWTAPTTSIVLTTSRPVTV